MAVFNKEQGNKGSRVTIEIIKRVNDNIRRLRIIEQKQKAYETHLNSTDDNVMTIRKSFQKALNERDARIAILEDKIQKLEALSKEITKQMKMLATKGSVEELKNTVDIFNPLN